MRGVIGPWTIPPARDWSERGGNYRAIVEIRDGHIISARLEKWGVTKHVCFGQGENQHGWLPLRRSWISTPKHDGERNPYACEKHWIAPSGNCYDCMVLVSAAMGAFRHGLVAPGLLKFREVRK